MKIALVGYGKMGKIIDGIATSRGHEIIARLQETPTAESLADADVAIEFSQPEVALKNIEVCLQNKIPVVCGTTGWLKQKPEAEKAALQNETAFIYGSNFSLGVNLFFEMNERLAQLMNGFPEYTCSLEETHHTHKKDAPSGTAISAAEGIIRRHPEYSNWQLGDTEKPNLGITAIREDEVPGTHVVSYTSEVDSLELTHTAFSREGFALGAVVAAEWILGRKGIFTMKDVLGL